MHAFVQSLGRKFGVEIRRNGPSSRDDLRLAKFLRDHCINLVFDIGANRGQFAKALFAHGYAGDVVSFEALPGAHAELAATAGSLPGRWRVAPAMALSDRAGSIDFHVNAADATSSLLPASAESLATIAGIQPQSVVQVPTQRLDDVAPAYLANAARLFLKIDVQGGEALVLAGGAETLARADGMLIELSLTELYAGQPLAFDVLGPLLAQGFELFDIAPAYRDPASFRLQQIDAVLFRAR